MSRAAGGATMADWLALHDLDASTCRRLFATLPARVSQPAATGRDRLDMTAGNAWNLCAAATRARLPGADAMVDDMLRRTHTDFHPDRQRYPRAFTLHDGGNGHPYVSCPWEGRIGDLLTLAHEFGHALQISAAGGTPITPVLRETCAILSELWLARHLRHICHPAAEGVDARLSASAERAREKTGQALLRQISLTAAPYDYAWNYPVARALACLADARCDAAGLSQILAARCALPDLIDTVLG